MRCWAEILLWSFFFQSRSKACLPKCSSRSVSFNVRDLESCRHKGSILLVQFTSVQSVSHVQCFATPWTAALQASLSITSSWSLLKLKSIESVMSSNHLILCRPLFLLPSIFPSIRVFSNESVLRISGQSIGVSASASVL